MDLRLPIGYVFTIYGLMLTGYGLFTNGDPMYAKSLNMNFNTIWGVLMLVFGLVMLFFAKKAGKKQQSTVASELRRRYGSAYDAVAAELDAKGKEPQ